MKMIKWGLIPIIIIVFLIPIQAQVKLPAIFNDHMVLQQNFAAPIWGWAAPGTEITVSGNWSRMPATKVIADQNGQWSTKIQTTAAGGPYELYINDMIIKNVMLGEVWICSGQSNMQMALDRCENATEEINKAQYPNIRFFYVARDHADEPSRDCYGDWVECSPESTKSFSAVAYYFGREIYQELKVPIGLIHVSWGGSSAQAWVNENILKATPAGEFYIKKYKEECQEAAPGILLRNQQSPSALYNAMLKPLIPYGIKGAIWYQGEANTQEHEMYKDLMTTMISNWRAEWNQGDFPFYYVQLAPFNYSMEYIGAALRDAQRKSLDIPNTGMAVTMDIGNLIDIHPIKKKEIGERLALWAMAKNYGKEGIVYSGPLYKSMHIEKNKILLSFDYIGSGLWCKGKELSHFTIAGADQVFYPAKAIIKDDLVMVSSSKVKNPKAIRYAFLNGDEPNLFNQEGLPASSFRTDDWKLITKTAKITSIYDDQEKGFVISMYADEGDDIRYSLDGSEPNAQSKLYTKPLMSKKNVLIKAKVFVNGEPSLVNSSFKIHQHLANGKQVSYTYPYDPKYNGGGDFALVNSVFGSSDFSDGNWQGFQGENLEVIIDMEELTKISSVAVNALQVVNSWIVLPKQLIVYGSLDGQEFHEMARKENTTPAGISKAFVQELKVNFKSQDLRYVKVQVINYGPLPEWHLSAGEKAWLFVDEIIVE